VESVSRLATVLDLDRPLIYAGNLLTVKREITTYNELGGIQESTNRIAESKFTLKLLGPTS